MAAVAGIGRFNSPAEVGPRDAEAVSVRLLTDNGQTYMVASRGLSPEVIKQELLVDGNRCLCGKIARHGGFGVQKGLEQCNQFLDCAMLQGDCHELIVVPLQYRDKILGVYNLFLSRPSAELGKDVRDLLNSIGMHLGLAVEKARLDDNERRLAIMEERNMMGNELHDSLAQSLVSMRLQTKMLGELLYQKNTRAAQNEVRHLRSAVEEAHVSLRELLANFKTGMDARGLIPSIFNQVKGYLQYGDIRGVYARELSGVQDILDLLERIKSAVDVDRLPAMNDLWRLNQKYGEALYFGQYVAEIFAGIKD